MKLLSCLFILCMVTSSCANRSKEVAAEDYTQRIEDLRNREIIFPDAMIDINSGDTIDLSGHDYIIFNYIDSLGCATCKMKLPIWKKFISLLDSVSEADVLTVMAIHPSARRDIPHIVRQQEFDYPVCIDVKNTIRDLNSLTTDVNLNTFLLDKRHRVITLGNPTYSNKIADFYRSIITGETTISQEKDMVISLDQSNVGLGSLKIGEQKQTSIEITNIGSDTAYIREVLPSCDCVTVSLPSNSIPPNGHLSIPIHFKGDSVTGPLLRTIDIFYQGFEYPSIIQLSGEIIP